MIDEQQELLTRLFNPYYAENYQRVVSNNIRFVHYTSALAATQILKTKSLWLRNCRTMNDFSEIEYGKQCLSHAFGSFRDRLNACLENVAPGLLDEVIKLFDGWAPRFQQITYLNCFSEHDAEHEDEIGRLSMWRAYGGNCSVAIVLNNAPFMNPTDALTLGTSPVLYASPNQFAKRFGRVVENLEQNSALLNLLEREDLKGRVFHVLLTATLCTKHPGFREEREWRVIFSEEMDEPLNITRSVDVVGGVPQFVYTLPLRDIPSQEGKQGFFGAEIPDVVDRIIIGPSDDARVVQQAVIHLLAEAGVKEPEKRVFVSGIPLRR